MIQANTLNGNGKTSSDWQQAVGGHDHRRNRGEDRMNLFVTMAIISFLLLQASCVVLLSCESDMRGTQNTMVDLCIKSVGIIGIEQVRWRDWLLGRNETNQEQDTQLKFAMGHNYKVQFAYELKFKKNSFDTAY